MAASGTTGFPAGAGAGVLLLAMTEQTSQKARFERLENVILVSANSKDQ